MMPALGQDFRRAKSAWLYGAENRQTTLFVVLATVGLVVLQLGIPQLAVFAYLFSEGPDVFQMVLDKVPLPLPIMTNVALVQFGVLLPTSCLVVWLLKKASLARGGEWNLASALAWPSLGWGGWTAIVAMFFVAQFVIGAIIRFSSGDLSMGGAEELVLMLRDNGIAKFLVPLATILAAPVVEELLFRGPLFSRLVSTSLGPIGTVIATSACWASIHLAAPLVAQIQLFFMGAVLGLILLRFGSLWICIVLHASWNAMSTFGLFFLAPTAP